MTYVDRLLLGVGHFRFGELNVLANDRIVLLKLQLLRRGPLVFVRVVRVASAS